MNIDEGKEKCMQNIINLISVKQNKSKEKSIKQNDDYFYLKMKKSLKNRGQKKEHDAPQKKNDYRNANLEKVPDELFNFLKDLFVLDVSHNFLENMHAESIIKAGPKLKTLYINHNLINVIPSSLVNLKFLSEFSHDWSLAFGKPKQQKLEDIKNICRKPDKIVKVASVVGINFKTYCQNILKISLTKSKEIKQYLKYSECSQFAKEDILRNLQGEEHLEKTVKVSTVKGKTNLQCNMGCFNNLFFKDEKKDSKNQIQKKVEKSPLLNHIKISEIKTIQKNKLNETLNDSTQDSFIQSSPADGKSFLHNSPNSSLHRLFAKFDANPQACMEQANAAFQQGSNPNAYDKHGLTIFHTCVINSQKEGLRYLLNVNASVKGFIDLEIKTKQEGRNIFHLSVFLKKLQMATMLIEYGYPLNQRDFFGNRAINLVDENFQFLYMLKKAIKKSKIRIFPRHPFQIQQECQYKAVQKCNDQLLSMYDAATSSIPRKMNRPLK